jgi:hypothetical protein
MVWAFRGFFLLALCITLVVLCSIQPFFHPKSRLGAIKITVIWQKCVTWDEELQCYRCQAWVVLGNSLQQGLHISILVSTRIWPQNQFCYLVTTDTVQSMISKARSNLLTFMSNRFNLLMTVTFIEF